MAAHATKRAKEDDWPKKYKVQEEKEAAKRLKEETAKKKEKEELLEMPQNACISRRSSLKGSAPEGNKKAASQFIRQWGKFVRQQRPQFVLNFKWRR